MKRRMITAAVATTLLLGGSASADILRGEVYSVEPGDVYVEMADHTVARVPIETASFYLRGERVPHSTLRKGQDIVVDYTPIYGFQRYYYESADVVDPNDARTYIIDTDDVNEYIEYEGRTYRRVK